MPIDAGVLFTPINIGKLSLPGRLIKTFQHANATQKFDYLLLSPALFDRATQIEVMRKGFYAPRKWESYENINAKTKDRFQASDHHCLWAEFDL